jgi:8-oxo-dGTP pyrophosphatase MutT (NUDIX family)
MSVQEGVFVPGSARSRSNDGQWNAAPELLDEIDRRWNVLRAANPAYFDGRICHVLGVHRNGHGGASLHVMDCAYRFFAVQARAGDEFDLGVRPLGVKGVIEREGRLLMGRRSQRVAMYANQWEFAPSGSVDFSSAGSPQRVIVQELREETGLDCAGEPTAIAVLFDPILKCWEIVYRLEIAGDTRPRATDEYPDVAWFDRDALPERMSPIAVQIAGLLGL